MAERPDGYGLTAEVKATMDAKYRPDLAMEAMNWIVSHVPESEVAGLSGSEEVHIKLKDGTILCNLMNALEAGAVRSINSSKMAFKQMENIGKFLDAVEKYGVAKNDLFQTVDLYENTNMSAVINTIQALGRKASGKGLQGIGPKESNKNKREFTEEQLRAGDGMIGLQMGTNKLANQSGINFGKIRHIID